jgi:hypothetical protein
MSRYVKDLPTSLRSDEAGKIINDYLVSEGFKYEKVGNEMAWRKGIGALSIPQFIKAEPGDRIVHIEAWVSAIAVVPGVYAGEQDLSGFWGWAVKSALRRRVTELERRLVSATSVDMVAPPAPEATAAPVAAPGWLADPTGRHESRYWDGGAWTDSVADQGATSTDPA